MAKMSGPVARVAEEVCKPLIEELGYDLIETEYVREGERRFLRFYIDRRGGIGLEDCELVSRTIDPVIDEKLTINEAYNLEVSSPGLDRPLKTGRDLLRHLDEEVEVSLYKAREGGKKFTGFIVDVTEDEDLVLELESGEEISFSKAERAKVKRVIRF